MKKKLNCLVAGVAAFALILFNVYLAINDTVNEIIIIWLTGFNIVFIAYFLVWCGLNLEKDDEGDK